MRKVTMFNKIAGLVTAFVLATSMLLVAILTNEFAATFICVLMIFTGAMEMSEYLFSLKVLKLSQIHTGILAVFDIAFGLIFMLVKTDAETIVVWWAIIELLFSLCAATVSSISIKHSKLNIVNAILYLGYAVFCVLLLIKGPEDLRGHIYYYAIMTFIFVGLEIYEIIKEKKLENPIMESYYKK